MRLIILTIVFGFFASTGFCQKFEKTRYVKARYIELHHQDSTTAFTVFIEPDGYFYFKKGFIHDSKDLDTTYRFNNNRESTKNSIFIDTNKVKVISRFDNLVKDSTDITSVLI